MDCFLFLVCFALCSFLVEPSFTNEYLNENESDIVNRMLFVGNRYHRKQREISPLSNFETNRFDMAILIAYFNPIGYVRTTMNVLYVINKLRNKGYPLYVAEVSLQGKDFTLAPEHRQLSVKTDSVLFYKENIFNMLEKTIPGRYQKLVLMDCNVEFDSLDWYRLTSILLETNDVVQPFHVAHWMNINYSIVLRERYSYLNVSSHLTAEDRINMKAAPPSHEGFAWAFRRPLFQAMGGMPEFAVLTGGDTIVALAVSPISIRTRFFLHQLPYLRTSVGTYNARAQVAFDMFGVVPGKRTTCSTPGAIRHLFHGSRSRRRYDLFEIHKLFVNLGFTLNATYIDMNGLYRYHDPSRWNRIFFDYFASRLEDNID